MNGTRRSLLAWLVAVTLLVASVAVLVVLDRIGTRDSGGRTPSSHGRGSETPR